MKTAILRTLAHGTMDECVGTISSVLEAIVDECIATASTVAVNTSFDSHHCSRGRLQECLLHYLSNHFDLFYYASKKRLEHLLGEIDRHS